MALFSSAIYNLPPLLPKIKSSKYLCVRSHSFPDADGNKAANNVDANMHVLKQRMDQVRIIESSKSCVAGWTYKSRNLTIHNKGNIHSNSTLLITSDLAELIGKMGAAYALVFVSGSLGICLISIIVHFSSHL